MHVLTVSIGTDPLVCLLHLNTSNEHPSASASKGKNIPAHTRDLSTSDSLRSKKIYIYQLILNIIM